MTARNIALKAIIAIFTAVSGLAVVAPVHADDFIIHLNDWHYFYASTSADFGGLNNSKVIGGDMNGILNGTALAGAYCVDLFTDIYVDTHYPATYVTGDGKIYGTAINNATQISWLLGTYGASATTYDQQNALQAAIWRVENGTKFQLDGADNAKTGNSATVINLYQSYLTALGNNTAPTSSVLWISAQSSPGLKVQGIVGLTKTVNTVPEPGSLALLGMAALPLAGLVRRRKA